MSLAMFAAPFDENNENNDNSESNLISKKRLAHNKTQKKYPKENFDTNKVNSMLAKIHNSSDDESEDNFNPPPKAVSAGVQRTIPQKQESMSVMNLTSSNDSTFRTLGRAPQPIYEKSDNLDLNDYGNYGNEEYYKQMMSGYNTKNNNNNNKPYYLNSTKANEYPTQDVLLQKLNYMITLLEDQQDEKTNNVTEEVVLYSFLGVFIIFIADTFVKAGKYVR
jgi:hypothetical protein